MMLGNIDDISSVYDAFRTPGFAQIAEGSIARRDKCASCEIFEYCQGGCSIDAYWEGDIRSNGNPSCLIYKAVFTHIKNELDSIIDEQKDLSKYNRFVREAVLSKITNPVFSRHRSDRRYLYPGALGEVGYLHAAPRGVGLDEHLAVDLVHGGEIVDVLQIQGDIDDPLRSGVLQDL